MACGLLDSPPTFRRLALSEVGGTILFGAFSFGDGSSPFGSGERNGGTHLQIAVGVGGRH